MNPTVTFIDSPPPTRHPGRPRKYVATYEACKANPGMWCIWAESLSPSSMVHLRRAYPGMKFVSRRADDGRTAMWGSYDGGAS